MNTLDLKPAESRDSALKRIASLLADAGLEEPQREARLLFAASLDLPLSVLITHGDEPLGPGAARLGEWLNRRLNREPLSRIRGGRDFYGRWFLTSPAVLDPRPETELLVDIALKHLSDLKAPRLLDLGTGSGAIIVSLLAERPDAQGIGVDLSSDALAVAARNAAAHEVADRLILREGDLFGPVEGVCDLVVSNPPYIPSRDLAALDPEVRDFDPALALDGGEDGLAFYRRIIEMAPAHLKSNGLLALELGIHQADAVRRLAEEAGFGDLSLHCDLAGIERHLTARWKKVG